MGTLYTILAGDAISQELETLATTAEQRALVCLGPRALLCAEAGRAIRALVEAEAEDHGVSRGCIAAEAWPDLEPPSALQRLRRVESGLAHEPADIAALARALGVSWRAFYVAPDAHG